MRVLKCLLPFISISTLLVVGCSDSDAIECSIGDSIADIPWMRGLIDNCPDQGICKSSIFQAKYEDSAVYYTSLSGPLCDTIFLIELRDCEGSIIATFTDFEDFDREVLNSTLLFRCE